MNAKISVFIVCVEAIIYLLLYNLHHCTFKKNLPTKTLSFKEAKLKTKPWIRKCYQK